MADCSPCRAITINLTQFIDSSKSATHIISRSAQNAQHHLSRDSADKANAVILSANVFIQPVALAIPLNGIRHVSSVCTSDTSHLIKLEDASHHKTDV